jgi:hypothetical protein
MTEHTCQAAPNRDNPEEFLCGKPACIRAVICTVRSVPVRLWLCAEHYDQLMAYHPSASRFETR